YDALTTVLYHLQASPRLQDLLVYAKYGLGASDQILGPSGFLNRARVSLSCQIKAARGCERREYRNSEIAGARSGKRLPSPAICFERVLINATSGRSAEPSISESPNPQTDEQPRARTS